MTDKMNKPTIEEMTKKVIEWFHETDFREQNKFLSTKYSELSLYHHTLGRAIRNEFALWTFPWEPEIVDGVDVSKEHPDAISIQVIKNVHKKLKELT